MSETSAPPRREMQDFEKVARPQRRRRGLVRGGAPLASCRTIQHFLHGNPTIVPVIVLIVSVLIFGAIANNFLTSFNLSLIIGQVTIIGILGIAQTLIILTAGIDLSVAAIMMLCSVIMGGLAVGVGVPALVAIPIGLVVGGLCGLLNGTLVAKVKLPPFIVDARHLVDLLRAGAVAARAARASAARTSTPRRRCSSCSASASASSAPSSPPARS